MNLNLVVSVFVSAFVGLGLFGMNLMIMAFFAMFMATCERQTSGGKQA